MNQPLTLDDLLNRLEKQAADDSSEKKDKEKDESKDKSDSEKKEDSKDGKSSGFPFAKKTEEDAEKKDEQVKEAQLSGAALAQEILQKVASANITPTENKDTEMNKQASVAGKALADSLLQKLASTGDLTTVDGIPAGVVPNKAQVDSAALVAEHDARVQPTPTADAKGDNGGSVNEIFDAIVADAMAAGAATPHELGHNSTSAAEGAIVGHQAPASINPVGVGGDEVEKAAAVSALVGSGFDFDSAVEMVKAAEEEILFEEGEQIKQAALGELVDAGVDFELAAALVKQASIGGVATRLGRRATVAAGRAGQAAGRARGAVSDAILDARTDPAGIAGHIGGKARAFGAAAGHDASAFGQAAGQAVMGRDAVGAAVPRAAAAKRALIDTYTGRTALGVAGAGAVAGGAYALGREKKAAVDGLVQAGVDFDSAVDLVNAKSMELYGA